MNRLALVVFAVFAVNALAQDRTITVKEAGVSATGGDISLQPDGGCMVQARGVNDAGVEMFARPYAFNGARCTTVRAALLQCLKNDVGVGNGSAP